MDRGPTLWLVGMMGSGKTSVGRLVADRLGLPFLDLDDDVATRTGRTIGEVFADEGEEGFRRYETEALERASGTAAVVATGGGAVLRPGNVELMRGHGFVVWLRAEASVLVARVGAGEGRPLLVDGPADAIHRLASQRAETYRAAAHVVVDTDGRDPETIATEVIGAWTGS